MARSTRSRAKATALTPAAARTRPAATSKSKKSRKSGVSKESKQSKKKGAQRKARAKRPATPSSEEDKDESEERVYEVERIDGLRRNPDGSLHYQVFGGREEVLEASEGEDQDADYYTWRLDQTLAKNVTRLVDYNERVEQGEGDPLEDRIERARDGQSTVLTNGEIGDWFWWRTTRHAREGIELLLLRAEGRAVLGKLRELVTQMEEDDAFRAVCFGDGRGDGAALEDGEAEVQDRDYHPGDLVRLNYDDASRDDDDGARHRELGELRRQYDELVRQDEEDELRLDNAMHLRSGRRPRSRS